VKGITICSTQTTDGPDEINGFLVDFKIDDRELDVVCGLINKLNGYDFCGKLSDAWGCAVFGEPEWLGTHMALMESSGKKYIRPVGTRLEFTSPKPAKKSRK